MIGQDSKPCYETVKKPLLLLRLMVEVWSLKSLLRIIFVIHAPFPVKASRPVIRILTWLH